MRRSRLLMVLAVVACGSPFDVDDQDLPLTVTGAGEYVVEVDEYGRFSLSVPFQFQNLTGETITMVYCANDRPLLERSTSTGWEYETGGDDFACLVTRELAPGVMVRDTARFSWGDSAPHLPATFRLRWHQLWADFQDYDPVSRSWGTTVPETLLISNTFEVLRD